MNFFGQLLFSRHIASHGFFFGLIIFTFFITAHAIDMKFVKHIFNIKIKETNLSNSLLLARHITNWWLLIATRFKPKMINFLKIVSLNPKLFGLFFSFQIHDKNFCVTVSDKVPTFSIEYQTAYVTCFHIKRENEFLFFKVIKNLFTIVSLTTDYSNWSFLIFDVADCEIVAVLWKGYVNFLCRLRN